MQANMNRSDTLKPTTGTILGLDLGTSGIRACLVQRKMLSTMDDYSTPSQLSSMQEDEILLQREVAFASQSPDESDWYLGLMALFGQLQQQVDLMRIDAIIADATSSSVRLESVDGTLKSPFLMYNNNEATEQADLIKTYSLNQPTAANGASSSLAKCLLLYQRLQAQQLIANDSQLHIVHQIDWLNQLLAKAPEQPMVNTCDQNNLLKLGYDPQQQVFPNWVKKCLREQAPQLILPQGIPAGTPYASINPKWVDQYGFGQHCRVHFGTTDSIAGFLATGAKQHGDAVSSLGSSIAIKVLTHHPIYDSKHGLYSHKIKNLWLAGGASNGGGKQLLTHYSLQTIHWLSELCLQLFTHQEALTQWAQQQASKSLKKDLCHLLNQVSSLQNYYCLDRPSERFPICDADFTGRLEPCPEEPVEKLIQTIEIIPNSTNSIITFLESFNQSSVLQQLLKHLLHFNSIVQGLVQIERQGYQLIQSIGTHLNNVYSVGGGNKNSYWQVLRKTYISNQVKFGISENAAYGVTRLIDNDVLKGKPNS